MPIASLEPAAAPIVPGGNPSSKSPAASASDPDLFLCLLDALAHGATPVTEVAGMRPGKSEDGAKTGEKSGGKEDKKKEDAQGILPAFVTVPASDAQLSLFANWPMLEQGSEMRGAANPAAGATGEPPVESALATCGGPVPGGSDPAALAPRAATNLAFTALLAPMLLRQNAPAPSVTGGDRQPVVTPVRVLANTASWAALSGAPLAVDDRFAQKFSIEDNVLELPKADLKTAPAPGVPWTPGKPVTPESAGTHGPSQNDRTPPDGPQASPDVPASSSPMVSTRPGSGSEQPDKSQDTQPGIARASAITAPVLSPATRDGNNPAAKESHIEREAVMESTPKSEINQQVPSPPMREISLRLTNPDSTKVDVRLSERAGQVHVAVRTDDREFAKTLQSDLGELVARLDKRGYNAQAWASAASTGASRKPDGSGGAGEHDGFSWNQQQQRQQQDDSRRRRSGQDADAPQSFYLEEGQMESHDDQRN